MVPAGQMAANVQQTKNLCNYIFNLCQYILNSSREKKGNKFYSSTVSISTLHKFSIILFFFCCFRYPLANVRSHILHKHRTNFRPEVFLLYSLRLDPILPCRHPELCSVHVIHLCMSLCVFWSKGNRQK